MRAAFAKCFFLRIPQLRLGVHCGKLEGCVGCPVCRLLQVQLFKIPLLGTS